MDEKPKRVLIFLSKGLESPMVARSALLHATASAAMGLDTTLYFAAEGTDVAHKEAWKKENVAPGKPTLKQRMEEAKEANVKFKVCSQSMAVKGMTQEDLVEGAEITGAATLVDLALSYDTVISF
jgi:predicted peroxiredoxin